MPQLDFSCWFTQYFWFTLTFLILFFKVVGDYLPKIYAGLRIRRELLSTNTDKTGPYQSEEDKLQKEVDARIASAFAAGRLAFQGALTETAEWSKNAVLEAEATEFEEANAAYVDMLVQTMSETDVLVDVVTEEEYSDEELDAIEESQSRDYDEFGYLDEPEHDEAFEIEE
jgi:hypothetical protein